MKKYYPEKLSSKFNKDMNNFLIKNNPIMTGNELAFKFNQKFKTAYTKKHLLRQARLLGSKPLLSAKFKKGHKAFNKSPIGHERIKKNKDFVLMKVRESYENDYNECWEYKHIYLYKKYHGRIPENCVIIFLDRNKRNFSKDNLVAVDKDVFRLASALKLINDKPCDKEITKTALLIAQLYIQMNKIKFHKKKRYN